MLNYPATSSFNCQNTRFTPPPLLSPAYTLHPSSHSSLSFQFHQSHPSISVFKHNTHFNISPKTKVLKVRCSQNDPLKVMISGAPASGKGTQCEMIVQKGFAVKFHVKSVGLTGLTETVWSHFGLVHISTGDLLRSEVAAGSEIGNQAKEYMNSGRLVPDEVVTAMVIGRLSREDAKEKGWLLDGFPRSFAQAQSLEKMKIRPDVFVALDVPDEILIDRCVGRRLDPETGKIYHIKNFPPETDEIKARLITRADDTEEKVKSRLQIYKQNVEAILSTYSDLLKKIDGNRSKDVIFGEISSLLLQVQKEKETRKSGNASKLNSQFNKSPSAKENWRGIPTNLNNIPHSREIREYFYDDVLQATQRAIKDGKIRVKVEINIPELNPEQDVYRIGTLMELVRVLALSFADDGKRVKVCVQGSMGEGALAGIPLQLAGTRQILEYMDWGADGAMGTFINIGAIGGKEVDEVDDIFILVAPQNAMGNCIIDDLRAMTDAAGSRPVICINPRLKDLPASSGIMQTMGREKRLEYAASFEMCYQFRLLYYLGTQYPIMGALRMAYPYRYELFKRINEPTGKEKYVILSTFPSRPTGDEVNDAFEGKTRDQAKKASGFWGFLNSIFA